VSEMRGCKRKVDMRYLYALTDAWPRCVRNAEGMMRSVCQSLAYDGDRRSRDERSIYYVLSRFEAQRGQTTGQVLHVGFLLMGLETAGPYDRADRSQS